MRGITFQLNLPRTVHSDHGDFDNDTWLDLVKLIHSQDRADK